MLPALLLAMAFATDSTSAGGSASAAAAAPAPAPAAATPAPPRISGYVQMRSVYQQNSGLTNSLNRVRVGVDGALPQHVTYKVMVEYEVPLTLGAANVSLRDAYMKWTHGPFAITAGQFKTPFSRQYVTSITAIETADRAAVVDLLAPKRDIGAMAEYTHPWVTLSSGVFNGEGQNVGVNRDSVSLLVSRVVAHPLPGVDLGASGAWNGTRSTRYGIEASAEWRGFTARGEWIGMRRAGALADDLGWFALAAYRALPWLQLKAQQEDFRTPVVPGSLRVNTTTVGANLDLPGGRNRIILEFASHRVGSPFHDQDTALAQWQIRF